MSIVEFAPYENLKPWRLRNIDDIPVGIYGIYGLWYRGWCIYVGKAKDQPIKQRLRQHWQKSHNEQLTNWIVAEGAQLEFAYLALGDPRKIDEHERYYIKRFSPLTNRQHNNDKLGG